jgi:hypothetical protein
MRDARILLLDTFFKIKLSCSLTIANFVVSDFGFLFSSLTTKLAIANEQLSLIYFEVTEILVTEKKIDITP